jgi:hypothetical protein
MITQAHTKPIPIAVPLLLGRAHFLLIFNEIGEPYGVMHNHPSGDPSPSREDIEMTKEIKHAANALSIVLHDHVIVGNGQWLSFRKAGLL